MYRLLVLFCVFITTFIGVEPILLKSGQCPPLKPKKNFNINKFLGDWYVIRRDRTEADCIRQNVTTDGKKYYLTEIREPLARGVFLTRKNEIRTDNKRQSRLYLGTPYGQTQPLLVLMTDYDNYAVTYSCIRGTFGHIETVSIMSRKKTLSPNIESKIYRYIRKMGLSTKQLLAINHDECEEPEINENGYAINKPWTLQDINKWSYNMDVDDDKYWR